MFTLPGVTGFLSNKINQDPLEKFFGIQRQAGRSSDNPTVAQFIKNTDTIRIINSIWIDDVIGNCRGKTQRSTWMLNCLYVKEKDECHLSNFMFPYILTCVKNALGYSYWDQKHTYIIHI